MSFGSNMAVFVSQKMGVQIDFLSLEPEASNFLQVMSYFFSPVLIYSHCVQDFRPLQFFHIFLLELICNMCVQSKSSSLLEQVTHMKTVTS